MKRGLAMATLLALLAPAYAFAHPVALGASVTPAVVDLAGQVEYTITAEWPAGWSVAPPRLGRDAGSFEVKECRPPRVVATPGGGGRMDLTCKLTAFDGGNLALPTPALRLVGPDGQADADAPPQLFVASAAPEVGDQPRPAKGPEAVERNWRRILLIAGAALAGAAFLAAVIWLIVRRLRNRPPKAEKLPPPEPFDVRALRRLADPELQDLMVRRETKPFYSALTEIVREYLEGRYAVPALERTTAEILTDVQRVDLKGHERCLRDLLRTADLAKFADAPIPLDRWPTDRDNARRLVEDTRAIEVPPSPPDSPAPKADSREPTANSRQPKADSPEPKAESPEAAP